MINRRLMIVPPAMPSSCRTEQLDEREKKFLRLLLEMANMRVEGTDKGARMSRLLNEAFLRFRDRLAMARPSEQAMQMGLS